MHLRFRELTKLTCLGMSHCVGVKDTPSRATHDADVVMRIREAGGIPLLVSNTPELCMWFHTFNNVTGVTRNPYDTRRTAGGSSGGEVGPCVASFLLSLCFYLKDNEITATIRNSYSTLVDLEDFRENNRDNHN